MSEFWHPNASDRDMEAAWDAIDTNALPIALHDKFAKSAGLPASTHFPWDTERSIYYIKGIHDLHCLVGPIKFFSLPLADTVSRNWFAKPLFPSIMAVTRPST